MTTTKNEINELYQQTLKKLVDAKEQMLDFMALVEMLPSENPYVKSPENQLKADIINLRTSLYDKLRHFLNDYDMKITSSEIQNSIDDLPDDVEADDCEHEYESALSDYCKHCGAPAGGGHYE